MNPLMAYAQRPPFADYGYEPKTTYWGDFTVAEMVGGIKDVEDTFKRAFKQHKDDKIYGTELCMVLNHKSWQHAETNKELSLAYTRLWEKLDAYIIENWKGDDLSYFLRTTD